MTTKKRTKSGPTFRDRIVGLVWAAGSRLKKHPENWRTHPHRQREAFAEVLREVGIADAAVAFVADDAARAELLELPDRASRAAWLQTYRGKLTLIDGHLRREMLHQEQPVLVLDVGPQEARKALASHDAITALAEANADRWKALAERAAFDDGTVRAALESSLSRYRAPGRGARGGAPKSLAEVVDVTAKKAEFFLSARGPVPMQPEALELLRRALRKIPGVRIEVGLVGS